MAGNVFPQGWIIKMLLSGETLNIFLQTGISKKNIFFIKKKKNVVIKGNIPDKFVSTNLTYKLKFKKKMKNQHFTTLFIKNY